MEEPGGAPAQLGVPMHPEFTRPAYSSIRFGLLPAAWMTVGWSISLGMPQAYLSPGIDTLVLLP